MPRIRTTLVAASLAAGALLFAGSPACAEEEAPQGKQLFVKYCGSCHGPDGKGDGMLASALKQKPANLTLIAQKNGGKFPEQTVMRFIDGTTDVRAHGNPDMPVWGEVFKEHIASSPTQQAEIRATILSIVNYIGSIQQK
jgi:mono/diheme cytochrome c family protein